MLRAADEGQCQGTNGNGRKHCAFICDHTVFPFSVFCGVQFGGGGPPEGTLRGLPGTEPSLAPVANFLLRAAVPNEPP